MESFAGLLLRHRGRTGLAQRALADRIGASVRTIENWEGGVNYPSAKPLQALIAALLESGGLTVGLKAHSVEGTLNSPESGSRKLSQSRNDQILNGNGRSGSA